MENKPLKRSFSFSNFILEDVDPALSPDEIKDYYSAFFPALSDAVIEEPAIKTEGEIVYTFSLPIGIMR